MVNNNRKPQTKKTVKIIHNSQCGEEFDKNLGKQN